MRLTFLTTPFLKTLCSFLVVGAAAQAERVTVPGTTLSFEALPGWAPLSPATLERKYSQSKPSRNERPSFVYAPADGNDRASVAFGWKAFPFPVTVAQLPLVQRALVAAINQDGARQNKAPTWFKRGTIQQNGTTWLELELEKPLEGPGSDDRSHNHTLRDHALHSHMLHSHVLVTALNEKLLAVNANATASNWTKYGPLLEKVLASLRLR